MSYMQFQIYRKGATYSADCAKCGSSIYTHEWVNDDHNERRDAMQAGTCPCDVCHGRADPATFMRERDQYAGRFSAPGYLDCTEWMFDTNKRRLAKTVREYYGAQS